MCLEFEILQTRARLLKRNRLLTIAITLVLRGEREDTMSTVNKIKLLLVDDEAKFLQSVASRLELQNFDVTTATSGAEAISSAEKGYFDVAVVDFKMP